MAVAQNEKFFIVVETIKSGRTSTQQHFFLLLVIYLPQCWSFVFDLVSYSFLFYLLFPGTSFL
ncbi:hypothetical protein BCR42DRAFT_401022, partial [Absidia repens]